MAADYGAEGLLAGLERILLGDGRRYSALEIAEHSGLELDYLDRLQRSLGLALADPEEPVYTEGTLETARAVKRFIDAGLSPDGILEVTRVVGRSMAAIAEAESGLVADLLVRPGMTEVDLAAGWAEAARERAPLMGAILSHVLSLYRVELARQGLVTATELAAGRGQGTRWTAVCFADLVGFTRLGERVPPDELAAVAARLSELAAEAAEPPVRLVKLIGDAAMLVAPDPDRLLEVALGLLDAADAEGEDFPRLRAGLAAGEALRRAGDWYGRPVNLASRLTAHARPGSALATAELRDAVSGEYAWSFAGERSFRGIRGDVRIYRVRRAA